MYAASRTAASGLTAKLISKPAVVATESCLSVTYLLSQDTSKNFKIFLRREGGILNILDTIAYAGALWLTRYYNLPPGKYQILFEAELNKDKTVIDVISLSEGKCNPDGWYYHTLPFL